MLDNVAWLGHDSFRIEGSTTIYIDPWHLAPDAPPAGIVLVTHDHYDHFSAEDIRIVASRETVVVGPDEVTSKWDGESRTIEVGETIDVGGVMVTAVAAYNTSKFREPGNPFHPKEDGKLGYVVELDGVRYYHAGDTDATPEMSAVEADVAFIPVSGTYVMTADEAVEACATLHAGVVVPMHYDTIVGSLADAQRFKEHCALPVEILPKSER